MEVRVLSVKRLVEFAQGLPADAPVAERICLLAAEDVRGVSQGFDRKRLAENGAEVDLALASMSEAFSSVERLRQEHTIRHKLKELYAGVLRSGMESGELAPETDVEEAVPPFQSR